MRDRPTITTLPAGGRYDVSTLNTNFTAVRNKFDELLGRNGTGGSNNSVSGNLDMNGNSLLNVGDVLNTSGAGLVSSVDYAEEWANKAEDSLVSSAAGGDQSDDYSSKHFSIKAAASATAAASSATSSASSATTAAATATTLSGAASTTSLAIGTGSKAFTVAAGLAFIAGDYVIATSNSGTTNYMHGQVASYSSTTLTLTSANVGGSGTKTDWTIRRSGPLGATGATGSTGSTGAAGSDGEVSEATAVALAIALG